jgi:hypothetical protein
MGCLNHETLLRFLWHSGGKGDSEPVDTDPTGFGPGQSGKVPGSEIRWATRGPASPHQCPRSSRVSRSAGRRTAPTPTPDPVSRPFASTATTTRPTAALGQTQTNRLPGTTRKAGSSPEAGGSTPRPERTQKTQASRATPTSVPCPSTSEGRASPRGRLGFLFGQRSSSFTRPAISGS